MSFRMYIRGSFKYSTTVQQPKPIQCNSPEINPTLLNLLMFRFGWQAVNRGVYPFCGLLFYRILKDDFIE